MVKRKSVVSNGGGRVWFERGEGRVVLNGGRVVCFREPSTARSLKMILGSSGIKLLF
jgi:hypothetical protein